MKRCTTHEPNPLDMLDTLEKCEAYQKCVDDVQFTHLLNACCDISTVQSSGNDKGSCVSFTFHIPNDDGSAGNKYSVRFRCHMNGPGLSEHGLATPDRDTFYVVTDKPRRLEHIASVMGLKSPDAIMIMIAHMPYFLPRAHQHPVRQYAIDQEPNSLLGVALTQYCACFYKRVKTSLKRAKTSMAVDLRE